MSREYQYVASVGRQCPELHQFLAYRCYREKMSLAASTVAGHVALLDRSPRMLVTETGAGK
jgi:hypothetical protein